jgi:hypothetical protein
MLNINGLYCILLFLSIKLSGLDSTSEQPFALHVIHRDIGRQLDLLSMGATHLNSRSEPTTSLRS